MLGGSGEQAPAATRRLPRHQQRTPEGFDPTPTPTVGASSLAIQRTPRPSTSSLILPFPGGGRPTAEWRVTRAEGRGRGVGRNTARFRRSFLRSGLSPTPVSQATAAPVVGLKPGLHGLRLRGGGSPCGYSAPGAGGSLCGQPLNLDFVGMLLGLREVVEHLLAQPALGRAAETFGKPDCHFR